MANVNWQVRGHYMETCSCDYLCPCITTGLMGRPTKGSCTVGLVFHVEQGGYGDVSLNDLNFAVLALTPGPMGEGNWSVGVVTDDRASAQQQQALIGIATGQAGGPMAGLGPLITDFRGVEAHPIQFQRNGARVSVSIPGVLEQTAEGVPGPSGEPMYLDNVPHPVTPRIALAKGMGSHMHAFGLNWDDDSGNNNAHFAPFDWRSN